MATYALIGKRGDVIRPLKSMPAQDIDLSLGNLENALRVSFRGEEKYCTAKRSVYRTTDDATGHARKLDEGWFIINIVGNTPEAVEEMRATIYEKLGIEVIRANVPV